MISRLLLSASENKKLEDLVSRTRLTRAVVNRYVAGTTLDEAIAVTLRLKRQGIDVSLDLLGESVTDLTEAERATKEYIEAIPTIPARVPGSTISVKPSQLGIVVDQEACARNLETLLATAADHGVLVEVDMEHSSVGRATLEIYRRLLPRYPDTRVAIQAALRSTQADLESFTDHKPRIRLVKGAFQETLHMAVQDKDEVTFRYQQLSEWALANLPDPAFGTHDDRCIDHVKATAARLGVDRRNFEFQMLYGVRRKLWTDLVQQGYRVRIYLPYGTHWYPYLMRRMAERPANLVLFLRSLIGD
jgi:proline dehydrogenase